MLDNSLSIPYRFPIDDCRHILPMPHSSHQPCKVYSCVNGYVQGREIVKTHTKHFRDCQCVLEQVKIIQDVILHTIKEVIGNLNITIPSETCGRYFFPFLYVSDTDIISIFEMMACCSIESKISRFIIFRI